MEQIAEQYACTVELTGAGHLRLRHARGWFVICPQTPSDNRRAMKNLRAELRRQAKRTA